MSNELVLRQRTIGAWRIRVVRVTRPAAELEVSVCGRVVNSIVDGAAKEKRRQWKIKVAEAVRGARGDSPWDPRRRYAITLAFRFHAALHGGHRNEDADYSARLDVENFVKPVVDALAASLFAADDQNLAQVPRWDYDDSGFHTLLIHRLPDPPTPDGEGIAIHVSSSR